MHYISGQSDTYRVTAVLLLCVKHHAHRNNSESRVYPLRCQDSRREATLPLLLVLQSGAAVASDLWVEGIQTSSRDTPAGCAASRPWHLPSRSDRAQTLRNTTSYILLQGGFTATPARCWAALYGDGCLSVRAAKAVSMRLARATSRHVCFMSRHAARS